MDLSPAKYPRVCLDLLPDHLTLPARPAPPASSLMTGGPVSLLTGGPSSLVAPAPANTLPFRSNGSGFSRDQYIFLALIINFVLFLYFPPFFLIFNLHFIRNINNS